MKLGPLVFLMHLKDTRFVLKTITAVIFNGSLNYKLYNYYVGKICIITIVSLKSLSLLKKENFELFSWLCVGPIHISLSL